MDGTTTERVIGRRYRLESVLGRGGMGVVWAAYDDVLGRPVAVKEVLPVPGLRAEELAEMRRRTINEARNAARLASGASVLVYDVVEEDGEPWIVMERLAPRNLDDVIGERGVLQTHEVAELGLSLLGALDAAHAVGVLHRDVKPSNVMFRGQERMSNAVLTDFGVARFAGDPSATMTGTLIGSPAFVSPERASGAPASPASDLWALGVTLWIAAEGVSPFRREGTLQTLSAVLTADPPPLRLAGPLAPVLNGLLHKDPQQRLSATEARSLLERVHGPRARRAAGRAPAAGAAAVGGAAVGGAAVGGAAVGGAAAAAVAAPGVAGAASPASSQAAPSAPAEPTPAPAPATPPAADNDPFGPDDRYDPDDGPDHGAPVPAQRRRGRGRLVVGALAVAAVGVAAATQLLGGGGPRQTATPGASPGTAPGASAPASPGNDPAGATTPGGAGGTAAAPGPTTGAASGPAQPSASATAPAATATAPSTPSSAASATAPTGTAGPSASPSTSASATPTTSASDTTAPGASGAVPAGMRRYTDSSGFSVAVPSDWTAERRGNMVYLRDPASSAYLLVDQTTDPKGDPVADWQRQEKVVSRKLSNYNLVRIDPLRIGSWRGADWEFTHGKGTHVLNRNLVTGPSQAYALYWSVPDSSWSRRLPQFRQITASFQPKG